MIKKLSEEDLLWVRKKVNNKVMEDINEFIQSGDTACEIVLGDYKNPQSAYNAYKTSATRAGFGVKFTVRGNRLFMFREDA